MRREAMCYRSQGEDSSLARQVAIYLALREGSVQEALTTHGLYLPSDLILEALRLRTIFA